ncbi:uncharacterized protein LOC114968006 [Acropora millepora]|uniref:uncharacterized protein LOC114968006 n=1 Tax=Acropora millepora TaxID=45264 RepID=UPI001CF415B8|nr:uncharacterized protein LOC114968006 [Acropora millepora]
MGLPRGFFLQLWLLAISLQHFDSFRVLAQGTKCKDELEDCSYYFDRSECQKHNGLTRRYCARTCHYCQIPLTASEPECKDLLSDCSSLIDSPSQCQSAKRFFNKYCPRTCGFCVCNDILPDCLVYAISRKQCQSLPFFAKYCRRTCNFCEAPSTKTSSASPSTALQETSTASPPSWSTKSTSGEESKTASIPAPDYSTTQSPRPPSATLIPSVSTLRPVEPQTIYPTTKQVLPPGPLEPEDCKDKIAQECMNLIARDKESCQTKSEFMKENCARSCAYCGCSDLLAICSALVQNNRDYCDSNYLFMKTNCPKSCDFCEGNRDVKPPTQEAEDDCIDKRKRCKHFASHKNYCRYHSRFMSRYCPKACHFCKKEYNFSITTDWKGAPIDHAPIEFQISALDSSYVRIHVTGPFFDNPGPPPCKAGSACSGLWDYEVAEVFFLGKKEKYLEIELSPHGQHLLLLLSGVRKKFMDKVPIEYTATIDRARKTWTGTAKIPIDYFPPDVSKINAYAIHGSGANRRYESLYPASSEVSNPDFHRLEFFEPFDFESMFTMSWSKPLSPFWRNTVKRILRA